MRNVPNYAMSFAQRDKRETQFLGGYEDFINDSPLTNAQRFMNFSLYSTRQDLARFLFRSQMFNEVLGVHGSVVECGVL